MTGRLTWFNPQTEQHTQSPDIAQSWRDAGSDVHSITDPDEIAQLLRDETITWAIA